MERTIDRVRDWMKSWDEEILDEMFADSTQGALIRATMLDYLLIMYIDELPVDSKLYRPAIAASVVSEQLHSKAYIANETRRFELRLETSHRVMRLEAINDKLQPPAAPPWTAADWSPKKAS